MKTFQEFLNEAYFQELESVEHQKFRQLADAASQKARKSLSVVDHLEAADAHRKALDTATRSDNRAYHRNMIDTHNRDIKKG